MGVPGALRTAGSERVGWQIPQNPCSKILRAGAYIGPVSKEKGTGEDQAPSPMSRRSSRNCLATTAGLRPSWSTA